MAEVEQTPKAEVQPSPVGTPKARGGKNKDGFIAGQIVSDKDYHKFLAEQRQKSKK